ncbi:MAG: GTPase Era [Rickettsiaceae bacterium]|nr:MAG: GTPase Era [Rickettsiaceae bacterium]
MVIKERQKSISICVIGKPNAGKSSLLNSLVGQKISIVTHKVQTTRSIITGIVTIADTQIMIFDTPGIFEPKKTLERAMVKCAWSSLNSADIVALIIDSTKKLTDSSGQIFAKLKELGVKPVFLLNKIDIKSEEILNIKQYITDHFQEPSIIETSAISTKGINKFITFLKQSAKLAPWNFTKDDMTTCSSKFIASELTREQLFLNLHEELPYNLTVQTELWQQYADGSVKINQIIVVSREGYKTIILGKHGSMIKKIGSLARLEIEKSFGFRVHLFLFIKVREEWENNPEFYNYMGLKLESKSAKSSS